MSIVSDTNSNQNQVNKENVGNITRQDGTNNLNTQGTGDSTEKPGFFSNIFGKKSSDTPSSEATEKPWWKFWKGGRKSKKNKSNKKRRSGKKRSNKKR